MAFPFVLMAAGTAMQVYGQYQANVNQADAEIQNADFYAKEAAFAREAQFRQSAIAARNYEFRKGAQVSAFAKGGIESSTGSASTIVAETLAQKVEELTAIRQKGELEYGLAIARSRQSTNQAQLLSSFRYNALQAGGTILTNTARASDNNPNSRVGRFLNKHFGD